MFIKELIFRSEKSDLNFYMFMYWCKFNKFSEITFVLSQYFLQKINKVVVSIELWKNRPSFHWVDRLYFAYESPVKAEFNGLSARPWLAFRRKILVTQAKKGEVKALQPWNLWFYWVWGDFEHIKFTLPIKLWRNCKWILLKDKLDEMDKIIDEKISKALMSNVQVNDQSKISTSALAYAMQQSIKKMDKILLN